MIDKNVNAVKIETKYLFILNFFAFFSFILLFPIAKLREKNLLNSFKNEITLCRCTYSQCLALICLLNFNTDGTFSIIWWKSARLSCYLNNASIRYYCIENAMYFQNGFPNFNFSSDLNKTKFYPIYLY